MHCQVTDLMTLKQNFQYEGCLNEVKKKKKERYFLISELKIVYRIRFNNILSNLLGFFKKMKTEELLGREVCIRMLLQSNN